MSREQIVRDTAYAIWEAEGKPVGRDAQHWKQAEERVAATLAAQPAKTKPPVKGEATASAVKASPEAKPSAKIAATKAAPIRQKKS